MINIGDTFFLSDSAHYGFGVVYGSEDEMRIKWKLISKSKYSKYDSYPDSIITESFIFSGNGNYIGSRGNILDHDKSRIFLHLGKIDEKKKLEIMIKYVV